MIESRLHSLICRSPARVRGLTLVELMVALVLSLVLMTGVITVFVANKTTFRTQEVLAELQENGRIATSLVTRDIRDAGYMGCDTGTPRVNVTLNDPDDYEWDYAKAVDGFEATSGGAWAPSLPTSLSSASPSPVAGTDVVTVRYSRGAGARVIQHNTPSADIKVVAGADLKEDEIVMVSDCTNAAVFQVTQVQVESVSQTNIVHNTNVGGGSKDPGNATKDLGKKYLGGEAVVMTTATYYIGTTGDGERALYRIVNRGTPQELVRGVEDLQVTYGVDTSGDRMANSYQVASGALNWEGVVSVRLSALVRSSLNRVADQPQQYTYNGSTVTASDLRLRQPFSTTVAIRNKSQ